MADITISGKIVKRTGAGLQIPGLRIVDRVGTRLDEALRDLRIAMKGERPPRFLTPLDVRIEIRMLMIEGEPMTFTFLARTDDQGRFAVTFDLDPEALGVGFVLRTRYEAFLPPGFGDTLTDEQILTVINVPNNVPGGTDRERLFSWLQQTLAGPQIPVDTDGLRKFDFSLTLPPDGGDGFFDGVDAAVVEFFTPQGEQRGVAPLTGDDEARSATVLLPDGFQAESLWWRTRTTTTLVHEGTPGNDVCLARSALRTLDGTSMPGRAVGVSLAQDVGIGTMGSQVPDEGLVEGTPCVYRGIDLDFVESGPFGFLLRLRTDVGVGWEEDDGSVFLLMGLGKFQGHYRLELENFGDSPYADAELDFVIRIVDMGHSFDALPGTDIDDWVMGGPDALEGAIADVVSENVVPIIGQNITEAIRGPLEDMEDEISDRMEDFPLAVANMLATEYVHLNSFVTTADGVSVTGHGGLWSSELAALGADLACPFNVLALAAPGVRAMPTGRAYQKRLKDKGLGQWEEAFQAHREEIAAILRNDPRLAMEAALAARDLHPDRLGRSGKADAAAMKRLGAVAKKLGKASGPRLRLLADTIEALSKDTHKEGVLALFQNAKVAASASKAVKASPVVTPPKAADKSSKKKAKA